MRVALVTTSTLIVLSGVAGMPVYAEPEPAADRLAATRNDEYQDPYRRKTPGDPMTTVYTGLGAIGGTALVGALLACALYSPCAHVINPQNWTALWPGNWVGLRKSVLVHPSVPAPNHQAANGHNAEAIVDPDQADNGALELVQPNAHAHAHPHPHPQHALPNGNAAVAAANVPGVPHARRGLPNEAQLIAI